MGLARRKFTRELKMAAIQQLEAGSSAADVARAFEINPNVLRNETHLGRFELIIADEIFRARFRNGFEKPEAVPSNKTLHYAIDLHTSVHAFKKGHRVMVQVQSTWLEIGHLMSRPKSKP